MWAKQKCFNPWDKHWAKNKSKQGATVIYFTIFNSGKFPYRYSLYVVD